MVSRASTDLRLVRELSRLRRTASGPGRRISRCEWIPSFSSDARAQHRHIVSMQKRSFSIAKGAVPIANSLGLAGMEVMQVDTRSRDSRESPILSREGPSGRPESIPRRERVLLGRDTVLPASERLRSHALTHRTPFARRLSIPAKRVLSSGRFAAMNEN